MNAQTEAWLPPQQEGFGPWIEYSAELDNRPADDASLKMAIVVDEERRGRWYRHSTVVNVNRGWDCIVAYCVKLGAADMTQGPQGNLLHVGPVGSIAAADWQDDPSHPGTDTFEGYILEAEEKRTELMKQRDNREPSAREKAYAASREAPPAPPRVKPPIGLLMVAGIDHRCGGWK